MKNDFKMWKRGLLNNPVALAAYWENHLRREVSAYILKAMVRKGIDEKELAKLSEVPKAQIERVLFKERGGPVLISSLFRIFSVLGISNIELIIAKGGKYHSFWSDW